MCGGVHTVMNKKLDWLDMLGKSSEQSSKSEYDFLNKIKRVPLQSQKKHSVFSVFSRCIKFANGVVKLGAKRLVKGVKKNATMQKTYKSLGRVSANSVGKFLTSFITKINNTQSQRTQNSIGNFVKISPARIKVSKRTANNYVSVWKSLRKDKASIAKRNSETVSDTQNSQKFAQIDNLGKAAQIREVLRNVKKRQEIRSGQAVEFDHKPIVRFYRAFDGKNSRIVMSIDGVDYPYGTKIYVNKEAKKAQKQIHKGSSTRNGSGTARKICHSARDVFKKAVPYALAILPAGFIANYAINDYRYKTALYNQANLEFANEEATRSARESFVDAINGIDGKKWMDARDNASQIAQKSYDEYLMANPSDIDGAQNVFDNAFASSMQQGLGLTPEQYANFEELHTPIAEECRNNIDQWLDAGWQSLGYQNDIDAIEKNPEIFEGYINNEEWAVNAWNAMVEKASTYYLDAGVFDVMKSQASEFANNNIVAFGESTVVTANDYFSANPELGFIGAVGALGIGAVALLAGRYAINSYEQKHNENSKNEIEQESYRKI